VRAVAFEGSNLRPASREWIWRRFSGFRSHWDRGTNLSQTVPPKRLLPRLPLFKSIRAQVPILLRASFWVLVQAHCACAHDSNSGYTGLFRVLTSFSGINTGIHVFTSKMRSVNQEVRWTWRSVTTIWSRQLFTSLDYSTVPSSSSWSWISSHSTAR
jgi:hypothetical protein